MDIHKQIVDIKNQLKVKETSNQQISIKDYAEFLDHLFLLQRDIFVHQNDEAVDEELSWLLSIKGIKDDSNSCKMILDVMGDTYEH